jgi:TolA-binding protein
MKNTLYIIAVLFIVSFTSLSSQVISGEKFKIGQSYEKGGDMLSAQRIYLELYESNKQNKEYFDALKRTYMALNQYSDFLKIVEERFNTIKSPDMYALLGELLWRTGQIDRANDVWSQAIDDQKNPQIYQVIAESQVGLFLFEKAIATLLSAREETGNNALFADELSQLYIATGDYTYGTKEVMVLFEKTANQAVAQGRLSALMTSDNAVEHIQAILKQKSSGTNIAYKQLYVWFLRQSSQLEEALQLTIEIDKYSNNPGKDIYDFARNSLYDGHYDIALKAFEAVIDMGKNSRYQRNAEYEYVRTLEAKLRDQKDTPRDQVKEIIDRYEEIVANQKNDRNARDGKYRIAWLYYEFLEDNDKASEYLEELVSEKISDNINADALIMLGDISFQEGDEEKAKMRYEIMIRHFCNTAPDQCYKAKLRLAELMYFSGNIDSARAMYADLSNNFDKDYMNDAIEKIVIIDQNKTNEFAMQLYAEAEKYERQKNNYLATEKYFHIIKEAEYSDLAERSYINIINIYLDDNKQQDAKNLLEEFIEKYGTSIFGDYALLVLGDINMSLGNKEVAQDYYKDILVKYPRSIYIQEVRKKIRQARGETL